MAKNGNRVSVTSWWLQNDLQIALAMAVEPSGTGYALNRLDQGLLTACPARDAKSLLTGWRECVSTSPFSKTKVSRHRDDDGVAFAPSIQALEGRLSMSTVKRRWETLINEGSL